jgi:hypothetical protein
LRFFSNGSNDYLTWIDIDWDEDFAYPPVSACESPYSRIKVAQLTDNSGRPQLLDTNITRLWLAGDDLFVADDRDYAAISCMSYPDGGALEGYIVSMLDLENMGGDCFHLYRVAANFASCTLLASNRYGWGAFTQDAPHDKIYFQDRDTGRICYVDITTAPTAVAVLGEGEEPVSGAFFEMPQAEGFVVRTEETKQCLYGVSYPYLGGWANQSLVWPNGKYYLWKYHPHITDRIELFEEDRQDAWEALGLLAEAVDYQVGMDPEGTGFFRAIPDGSGTSDFTIDLDSSICRHFTVKKLDGIDEIVNRAIFIPYESQPGEVEVNLDLLGYMKAGSQVYFNGQTFPKSETLEETNVTLHCIKAGAIGTAKFKYLVHDFQIQTFIREDVNLSAPTQLRLDNNADLAAGLLVRVGDWDVGAKIASIQDDGDVILDTNMVAAFKTGTPVVFRSAEHGKWSTEYTAPLTYTSATTYAQIGTTGLFLQFAASDSGTTYNFAVGDRIRVYNPGMKLEKSRTKKVLAEDTDSIETYGVTEFNPDNPYMSLTLGRELAKKVVSDEDTPHHTWEIEAPMFLQARPHSLVTVKSLKHLPTATSNSEKCYVKQVSHDPIRCKSTIILRAVASYGT